MLTIIEACLQMLCLVSPKFRWFEGRTEMPKFQCKMGFKETDTIPVIMLQLIVTKTQPGSPGMTNGKDTYSNFCLWFFYLPFFFLFFLSFCYCFQRLGKAKAIRRLWVGLPKQPWLIDTGSLHGLNS